MNFEFLKTLQGAINLLQVMFGFAALFASSFIWNSTNLWFQFTYQYLGWQTLILAVLFFTWVFALIILLANIFEKDVLGQLGKMRLLIAYAVCLVLLIVAASLESWYISNSHVQKHAQYSYLKPRFIAVTIFSWMLVASYIVLILITLFFV